MTAVKSDFQKARSWLESRQRPRFYQMISNLRDWKTMSRAAAILKDLNQERLEIIMQAGVGFGSEQSLLVDSAIDEINAIAPLDDNMFEVLTGDGPESICLYPETCGYPMSWDDWEEIANDVKSCEESFSLFIFFTALCLGYQETFEAASQHWGWNVSFPQVSNIDGELVEKLLIKRGLPEFVNAINVIWYCTGNAYFDFNVYEESMFEDLPDFSVEGVRFLAGQYQKAEKISADLQAAITRFTQDKKIPKKLVRIWKDSIAKDEERPKTLAELFIDQEPYHRQVNNAL